LRTAACLAFAALFFVACCLLLNRQAGATLREMFRAVRRCVVQYSAFQQQRDAARVLAAAAHGLSARRIANARRMHPVAREQHAALRRSRAAVGELGEEFVVLLRDNESACEVLKHSIKSEKERHRIAVSQSALVQVHVFVQCRVQCDRMSFVTLLVPCLCLACALLVPCLCLAPHSSWWGALPGDAGTT
jgi:hypothetical protein